ncbi:MAG: Xaa-Pro peptidase family protein [Dehalococcoidales bacterium]
MGISIQEYQRRYAAIRELMKKEGLDSILVIGISDDFNRGNIRYIAGTGRGGVCIFPPEGNPVMLAMPNALASPKLPKTMEAFDLLDIRETSNNVEQVLKELARLDKGNKIGLVGMACMSVPMYLALKEKFGSRLVDLPWLFEPLRVIKSPEEIEKTRAAAAVADKVYARLRKIIHPGLSEYKIYGEVKKVIYEEGCEYGFDLVDGAGSTMNMAFFPTVDKLEKNGTLFMEISPSYQGYYAQLPVTLPVGSYLPHVKQMVMAWAEADKAVQKILRPGTKVSDLYNTLINTIKAKGFQSPLRPGHSIGLDILDYWSITDTNETALKPGMALAIHPCVMVKPGGDGVGMGYTYLITENGFERFSKIDLDRELI